MDEAEGTTSYVVAVDPADWWSVTAYSIAAGGYVTTIRKDKDGKWPWED